MSSEKIRRRTPVQYRPFGLLDASLFFIGVLILLLGASSLIYVILFPTYDVRYRLSVVIRTPTATIESKAVLDFSFEIMPEFLSYVGFGRLQGVMRSSAMRIDLGSKGAIYIINNAPEFRDPNTGIVINKRAVSLSILPLAIFQEKSRALDVNENNKDILKNVIAHRAAKSVPLYMLPMIVRFANENDPFTMEELDPEKLPGFELESVTLQMTDDEPSKISNQWPSWISSTKIETLPIKTDGHVLNFVQIPLEALRGN